MKGVLKFTRVFFAVLFLLCFNEIASAEEVVKMAIFPRKPALETLKAYEPLAQYLTLKIGKNVEVLVYKDFNAFWEGMKKKEADFVHLNQYQYVKARKELGYDVILMNEEFGSSKITSGIMVRKDSGINNVSDLKGKKILFGGGKQAMQSYIGATQILKKHGLKEGDYVVDFAINPPSAAIAVFNKAADAAGIGEVVLNLSAIKERIDVSQLKIIAKGDELPMLCWAVKKEMNKDVAEKIKKVMIGLKNDEEGKKILKEAEATAFVTATDKDYEIVRKVVKEALGEEY